MQPERIQRVARNELLARRVGFWWGFAEGLFFFIVPDVYVSFATLFSLRAGALAWFFSIAGSASAVVVIYLLAVMLGLDYVSFLDWIPGISGPLIDRIGQQLATEGLPYTPFLIMAGVPLKVYVAEAFALELSLGAVLLWTVFARIVRIGPTFAIVAGMHLLFGRWINARPRAWCALLCIFWLAFYTFYFVHMSRA
ncbi:MAG TPA: hypothetical protein VJU53_15400 [Burkholderiaceae bacterium]|nr:hypothetical protein [Burkholderiaceae bacterium]